MIVYIPTILGDVQLESKEKKTILKITQLTPSEKRVVTEILTKFGVQDFSLNGTSEFVIDKPLNKVHDFMVKRLKAGKETITAVKLSNGKLEEVRNIEDAIAKAGKDAKATTVEKPDRGCPMPATSQREIRASRVLEQFLTPQQSSDFNKYGAFIAFGSDTGERYRIAHRYSRYSTILGAIVFNLDRNVGICNELTMLPPSEEVLALAIMIQCRELNWIGGIN